MERDVTQPEEEGSQGQGNGRGPKPSDPYKLALTVTWKTIWTLGEIGQKRLKKGQDLTRDQLICEAIELLSERETGPRAGAKTPEAAAR
ncbi:MAG: hypothetical protein KGO96_00880 [Elusimicrobia bacterium]|nr:hypothetical protein [Elusimicrobiota bacterium]MDE2236545.1 hypothetical protein [Elusimicrobiota bacterium]MDE2424449.1 hypothetical protein [Elusimicrobiota bacterium]